MLESFMSELKAVFIAGKAWLCPADVVTGQYLNDELEMGCEYVITIKKATPKDVRTLAQNSSLHKYFSNLSTALNNAGKDQRFIMQEIGNGSEIPWSPFSIKALWKQVQLLRHGKDSTTQMEPGEYGKEHQIFDSMISKASGGVSCELPSRESQSYE